MNESPQQPEVYMAETSDSQRRSAIDVGYRPLRERRYFTPVMLFLITCLSTFWVGITHWQPIQALTLLLQGDGWIGFRVMVLDNWHYGLIYTFAVLIILFSHEMGHFIATVIYRVPASSPIFLPFPLNPIGTLGAVIAMQGNSADRRQIFDIGIAGPLAGLIPAIPIAFIGVSQLDLSAAPQTGLGFHMPYALDWLIRWYEIPNYEGIVWLNQLNPWFCAAWVGMLITGVNMMPVGQLDGGHVTYALFGKAAHTIAKATVVFGIAFMVYNLHFVLSLMTLLVILIGTNHPPTTNDQVKIGPVRWLLGMASLSVPFLCFPPLVFKVTQ